MANKGLTCHCIRCREPGGSSTQVLSGQTLVRRIYVASGGTEHFLSIESVDRRTLLGFVRLRLPPTNSAQGPPMAASIGSDANHDYGDGSGSKSSSNIRASDNLDVVGFEHEHPFRELDGAALIRE
eukprot:scaffold158659_cov33-Tisochrysis_lutea.AAC.1